MRPMRPDLLRALEDALPGVNPAAPELVAQAMQWAGTARAYRGAMPSQAAALDERVTVEALPPLVQRLVLVETALGGLRRIVAELLAALDDGDDANAAVLRSRLAVAGIVLSPECEDAAALRAAEIAYQCLGRPATPAPTDLEEGRDV